MNKKRQRNIKIHFDVPLTPLSSVLLLLSYVQYITRKTHSQAFFCKVVNFCSRRRKPSIDAWFTVAEAAGTGIFMCFIVHCLAKNTLY